MAFTIKIPAASCFAERETFDAFGAKAGYWDDGSLRSLIN